MLPTSACVNDIDGYGTNTDFFLQGTIPTTPCIMHRAVRLCTRSKKAAGRYCTSTKVVGVIYIPEGHPLRYAEDIDDVNDYFTGASINEEAANMSFCTRCR